MYKIPFFPFHGSCNLIVILVHATNLKSRSFTDLWAPALSRIITMLGHSKTFKFPSCTAQNSDSHNILYLHEPWHILEKRFSNGIDEAQLNSIEQHQKYIYIYIYIITLINVNLLKWKPENWPWWEQDITKKNDISCNRQIYISIW